MGKLLKHLKKYRKECFFAPFFKLCEAVMELCVPLIVASIIDVGIKNSDNSYILKMMLLLIVFALAGLTFAVIAQYFSAKAAVGFAGKIRHILFSHIQRLSHNEIDNIGTSTMITRLLSDTNQVQVGVNLTLRLVLRSPLISIGAMVMAFTIDQKTALVFLITIPVVFAVVMLITLKCIPMYKKVQSKLDKVLDMTRGNLTGTRVIRAFCMENTEIENFGSVNDDLTVMQKKVGGISALSNPLTYVLLNFAIIVLINIGAIRVNAGIITQGAVVALYNYMAQMLAELVRIAGFIVNVTRAVACGNRIQSVLDAESVLTEPETTKTDKENDYAVYFDNVTFKYSGAGDISLSDLTLKVEKGDTVGIIGGTGAGKSTLVNLIPRFYDVTEGNVFVDGINVKDYKLTDLRDKIGIVPQKAVLFKGTVRSNMLIGNENATDDEIMNAINIAQAGDFININSLDNPVEEGGKNFSGGQRQRLTIARALVRKPQILILDDSSSALDYVTDAALRRAIKELPENTTTFMVSQRTSSIQHADKIVVLDDGVPVGIGTHDELLKNCTVYKEIYDSQFKKGSVE